jgi:hypothetical protein
MVNEFPGLLAHATPVYHYDMFLPKVNQSHNAAIQIKKATLKGASFLQMLFNGKENLKGAKRMIKRSNHELPPIGRGPTNPILTISTSLLCTGLMKMTFHWMVSLENNIWSAIETS